MYDTELPIRHTRTIFPARKCQMVDDVHENPNGTAMDFTGATLTGHVRTTKATTGTKLADVSFDNDLPNGSINAYLTAAAATAIGTGATETDAAGRKVAYADIKYQLGGADPEQWYAFTLYVENVVTP
jgi:hypothetical protein